ncbi:type II toxin-antitoxin system HicB family antitoxin [Clostridium saccharoperbutylacetonicum]|uniref:type II toxin-antitoxin system HicB family antitoxin n=1 Tax=Clostridium saccharoperbutylacetonicum TaxID=36745 RepID=UPI0039EA5D76
MDSYLYFAIFQVAEEGGYVITFPDIPGVVTEGDDIEDGIRKAREALELHLFELEEDNDLIPEALKPEKIEIPRNGGFIVPIKIYMPQVREEMNNRAVNKTITLPYWLRAAAEREKINFSATLQQALKERLGLETPIMKSMIEKSNKGK